MALDTDTLSQFLDALDRFVKERLIPYEDRVADEDVIPPMLVDEIRTMGLFGMSIPEDFGGLGLSMIEEVQAEPAEIFRDRHAEKAHHADFIDQHRRNHILVGDAILVRD